MQDCILVLNAGSSSVKFSVFQNCNILSESHSRCGTLLLSGQAKNLGQSYDAHLFVSLTSAIPHPSSEETITLNQNNHTFAVNAILQYLAQPSFDFRFIAVGHRVVHGGPKFHQPTLINHTVIKAIQEYAEFAPLHNPVNLSGIECAIQALPNTPQVAVFDTAFHATLPEKAFRYAIPDNWYNELGIRRFGFHGINHHAISDSCHALLEQVKLNIVSVHLGNGCSLCAIQNGKSVDTTMGFTPLEGLVMGTRSGDLDPGLFEFLQRKRGYTIETITDALNHDSGLLGLSNESANMKTICDMAETGHAQCRTAIDLFCYRIAKHIASYVAVLGTLDVIAFTGGIGENAPIIRNQIISALSALNFYINPDENNQIQSSIRAIHSKKSQPIYIIPAQEESMIAKQTQRVIQNTEQRTTI